MGFIIKNFCRTGRTHLVGFLLVVLFLLSACSDANNHTEKQSHNIIKQDGRILFTLGDREFNVPEGNFKGGGETAGGELVQATLHGLLPDFEGYDKEKNHNEFVAHTLGKGWKSYARITLYRRADRITVPEMISRRDEMADAASFSGRLGSYDELRYGLEYYRSDNWGNDVYLYVIDGKPEILINCPSEVALKTRSSPSCSYLWDISTGTSYEMIYSMDYLPQWREIWGNAQRLLSVEK